MAGPLAYQWDFLVAAGGPGRSRPRVVIQPLESIRAPHTSEHESHHFATNNLLVAMPSLADGNFAQSVTLICEHSDKGALGIATSLDMKLGDVLAQ